MRQRCHGTPYEVPLNRAQCKWHPGMVQPTACVKLSKLQKLQKNNHSLYNTVFSLFTISNPKRWCCESAALNMPANLETSAMATGMEKVSLYSNPPKKGNAKECSNYHTVALISHSSKVMLKILQARLQQYVNCELPDVQARFRKGRGTRDQIVNIRWIIEKAREFQKNIY